MSIADKKKPDVPGKAQPKPLVGTLLEKSWKAFQRELPELLQEQRWRQWVAYHGGKRIGFANSQVDLYEECARRGYRENEVLVQCIMPEPDSVDPAEFFNK